MDWEQFRDKLNELNQAAYLSGWYGHSVLTEDLIYAEGKDSERNGLVDELIAAYRAAVEQEADDG